jgi:hypothetical protein
VRWCYRAGDKWKRRHVKEMVKEENDQNNFLFSFKMKDGELEYF